MVRRETGRSLLPRPSVERTFRGLLSDGYDHEIEASTSDRHQGRWNKQPIERLTPEPIAATEFVDVKAGEGTRRYETVAVDALGQEGEPSRPVWSRREWRKYYVPYVGEWHQ